MYVYSIIALVMFIGCIIKAWEPTAKYLYIANGLIIMSFMAFIIWTFLLLLHFFLFNGEKWWNTSDWIN